MKTAIFPIIFVALFLFSATKQPSRFSTAEEMGKALFSALQKNDSLHFLELYPTVKETNAAIVYPWKDSSNYEQKVQWADKHFSDNKAMPRKMFRQTRQAVINAGYNWDDVDFVSVSTSEEITRSPGITYLYKVKLNLIANGYEIKIQMSDAMRTKDGWNCGLSLRAGMIETPGQKAVGELTNAELDRTIDSIVKEMEAEADRMIDSMRIADSIAKSKKPR